MKHRPLGNSNLSVSSISLGCMEFGTRIDKQTAFALLDAYVDQGGNFLDTSNNYAFWEPNGQGGESETVLGEWLRARRNRSSMVVATKCGAQPTQPGGGIEAFEGLSRAAITKAVEQSLRRLGLDAIDLYYAHIDDAKTPLAETLETFGRLRDAGKIKEAGCSNYTLARLQEALAIGVNEVGLTYGVIQQRYSYLAPMAGADFGVQQVATDEMRHFLSKSQRVTLLAYGVLRVSNAADGVAKEYDTPENAARIALLGRLAQKYGATPQQIAIAWVMQAEPHTIPLVSSGDVARLRSNLRAAALNFEEADMSALNALRAC